MPRFLHADAIEGLVSFENKIKNAMAQFNTSGWVTYADAATTSPADGTGGSPNITWTRSTSSPLAGPAHFLWTKDANNRQGQGVSYDFSIDSSDQTKIINITFEWSLLSGTYSNGTAVSSTIDSDLTVWVYDVTNASVIQLPNFKLNQGVIGHKAVFGSSFQAASNSTSYRLIIHTSTTSASAYTVAFDSFMVARRVPSVVSNSIAIAQAKGDVPSTTAGNILVWPTVVFDPMGLYNASTGRFTAPRAGYCRVSGIVASGNPAVNMAVYVNGIARTVGGYTDSNGEGHFDAVVKVNAGDLVDLRPPVATLNPADSEDSITFEMLPGQETIILGAEAARTVAMRAVGNTVTGTIGTTFAGSTTINLGTVDIDTHGGYSNGAYTVPVPGIYQIDAQILMASTEANNNVLGLSLARNGNENLTAVERQQNASLTNTPIQISCIIQCVAGDVLTLRLFTNATGPTFDASNVNNWFSVARIAGPEAIGASEQVSAKYNSTSNSVTNGQTLIFTSRDWDTHSAYNTSTGIFTVPVAGKYRIAAHFVGGANQSAVATDFVLLRADKNSGAQQYDMGSQEWQASVSMTPLLGGMTTMQCNAGDTLKVVLVNSFGASIAGNNQPTNTWVEFIKEN